MKDINIPTLIICGKEDEVTPLVQPESMNSTIRGPMLRAIDYTGYLSNLKQPDEFNNHFLNFLTD